jgi:exosortase family protein XrtF
MSTQTLNWKDFKPTILFLVKFVSLYVVLSIVYGLYIEQAHPQPDGATISVTNQTAAILRALNWEVEARNHPTKPTTYISYQERGIVSVYEGCNGLNVGIIFLCFLLAFGPINKKLAWFAPIGLLIIHLTNLGRILGLFWVVIYLPNAVYFTHKYLFTAVIYAVVFGMWLIWLRLNYSKKDKPA